MKLTVIYADTWRAMKDKEIAGLNSYPLKRTATIKLSGAQMAKLIPRIVGVNEGISVYEDIVDAIIEIESNDHGGKEIEICPNCRKEYHKKRIDQKYCSTSCRVSHNYKKKNSKS